jgi:Domain of unknown function (DUF4124)
MRLLASFLLMFSPLVLGQQATVYKTVDEQGVVSFSDTPPADAADAEKLQIDTPVPQPTGEYEKNLEAMRETTDRMAEDRRAREKHRAEMRELAARSGSQGQAAQPAQYDHYLPSYSYSSSGHYRPGRPPWRPGYRPKPEHPIARPPHRPVQRPEHTRPTQGNAQLMRPITGR